MPYIHIVEGPHPFLVSSPYTDAEISKGRKSIYDTIQCMALLPYCPIDNNNNMTLPVLFTDGEITLHIAKMIWLQ